MTKPIVRDLIYRQRGFDADIIELCVRWYITYRLSYRDLVEMMAERGIGRPFDNSSMGDALRAGV
jgi:transposase-like protein